MEKPGNERRKASCKAIGGAKKIAGHKFKEQFGGPVLQPTTYKSEADATLINPEVLSRLKNVIGLIPDGHASLKSGKNLQFTLGRIDEITSTANDAEKIAAMSQRPLWEKYLKKTESGKPASLLVYWNGTNWIFFKMDDVITPAYRSGELLARLNPPGVRIELRWSLR
jgi:hypothetical protein